MFIIHHRYLIPSESIIIQCFVLSIGKIKLSCRQSNSTKPMLIETFYHIDMLACSQSISPVLISKKNYLFKQVRQFFIENKALEFRIVVI